MSRTFDCPKCGGPLDYDGGPDLTITCPYCHTSVVVPEELRTPTVSESGYARATSSQRARSLRLIWLILGVSVLLALLPILFVVPAMMRALPVASNLPTLAPMPTRTRVPAPTVPASPTPGLGSVVSQFGDKGTGPGLFTDARSIAVDGAGSIYVGDWSGGRVQVFDAAGKYVTQWRVGNSKTVIRSMASDRQGNVFVVADGEIFRVEGATGKPLGSLQYPEGNRFDAITATADGRLLAMWYEEQFGLITSVQGHRDDLVVFDRDGKVTLVIRGFISAQTDDPEVQTRLAVDGLGTLYALGGVFQTAVFKFTPEGKFVSKFGSRGNEAGQFSVPRAIAVDSQSRVYVADNKGIQVFDASGRYLGVFKAEVSPFDMVFDDKNELLVVAPTRVVRFAVNLR